MKELVNINRESGVPLVGCIAFGIIDRGTDTIQVRPTSSCNMNCSFCSTDGGPYSKFHKTDYYVELDYLLDWTKEVIKAKGGKINIFIDSVGDPMMYKEIVELVCGLKKMKNVGKVSMVTNGTLLSEDKINKLEKAGLNQLNVSFHSTEKDLAKRLFGMQNYNLEHVMDMLRLVSKSKIKLFLTPVWIKGLNDEEIPRIIRLCKELNAGMGLQKFEVYKYSRKPNGVKAINYWKFNEQLKKWEKEFNISLRQNSEEIKEEIDIHKTNRLTTELEIGEKLHVDIKAIGWLAGQMIGVGRNRAISINNCNKNINDKVLVEILENQNNIYIARII